jgi:hypothetical protein
MENDAVPCLISWPIVVGLWLLLGMFIAAGFLAWHVQVATYVDGSGIVLARGDMLQPAGSETVAVVFLPPDQAAHVRVGMPAGAQIGSGGVYVRGTVAQVEPGIVSPEAARRSYRLDGAGALLIAQPSVVVIVRSDTTLPAAAYAGSVVTAKVEIGSQRLLALLPGLGKFLGISS